MEKIRDCISKDLPPLRLYRDEVQDLITFLSSHCKESILIETCGYRLESPDEFSQLPVERTNYLFVMSRKPYIQVRLTQTGGDLYIGDGSIESEGLASHIEEILLRGKILYPDILNNRWVTFLISFTLPIVIILSNNNLIRAIAALALLGFGVWMLWDYYFLTKRFNTIIFKHRKEAPNFLKRKKDEIIILVIGAIIGAIITVLTGLILK